MTPEQKRIAIAEACGWVIMRDDYGTVGSNDGTHWHSPCCFPDYAADLNAIHAAEKVLTDKQLDSYPFILNHIVDRDTACRHKRIDCFSYHATAAQRAEAFGITLGLWREGE